MKTGRELSRRPPQGLRALEPGHIEKELGERNWHAVLVALQASIETLSHRTPDELVGALEQLEILLPDVIEEIGTARMTIETLDPVGGVKKLASQIFAWAAPALGDIVRRAQLREGAEARVKQLEQVRDQLRELRQQLSEKVNEVLEMGLRSADRPSYDECQRLREREAALEADLSRIHTLQNDGGLKEYSTISTSNTSGIFGLRDGTLAPYVLLYEEIVGEPIVPDSQRWVGGKEVAGKLQGLEVRLAKELANLRLQRQAILQPKRSELLALVANIKPEERD